MSIRLPSVRICAQSLSTTRRPTPDDRRPVHRRVSMPRIILHCRVRVRMHRHHGRQELLQTVAAGRAAHTTHFRLASTAVSTTRLGHCHDLTTTRTDNFVSGPRYSVHPVTHCFQQPRCGPRSAPRSTRREDLIADRTSGECRSEDPGVHSSCSNSSARCSAEAAL